MMRSTAVAIYRKPPHHVGTYADISEGKRLLSPSSTGSSTPSSGDEDNGQALMPDFIAPSKGVKHLEESKKTPEELNLEKSQDSSNDFGDCKEQPFKDPRELAVLHGDNGVLTLTFDDEFHKSAKPESKDVDDNEELSWDDGELDDCDIPGMYREIWSCLCDIRDSINTMKANSSEGNDENEQHLPESGNEDEKLGEIPCLGA